MTDNAIHAVDQSTLPLVVAVDGSVISYQAVAWAAVEARLRQWPLHILTAYGIPNVAAGQGAATAPDVAWLRKDGERVLAEATRIVENTVPDGAIEISTEFTFDSIIPTLLRQSTRARMLVVGNRGRGAVRRAILGSVSTAATRGAHCPVAVVPGVSETDPGAATEPVVVGVDGTENSVPAIEFAFEEASRRKVGLIAVHAWSDTTGFDLPVVGWEDIRQTEELLLGESLAGFAERYPEVTVERVVACDTPVRALLEHADKAQLLVVGSHGRGGVKGMLIGSTSTTLLHLAPCPMLVVRRA
ncbi:universal stress protein [Nocardia sp. NBC_01503]|uniref:universal stress protein n=1 Tax=Nocardia sp. NBC_01503 TaxID=2975997 RepID=UPI002E7AD09E|nr:universal stress protein [Nocardia sp. NBC_01503]WTL30624.1 universal stress protein [Nocardia sp. NBC_01503]